MLKEVFPEEPPEAAPNATPRAAPMPIPFPENLFLFSVIPEDLVVLFLKAFLSH